MTDKIWPNDEVIYTPEVVTVTQGESAPAIVEGISADGNQLRLRLINGEVLENVEWRLCQKVKRV